METHEIEKLKRKVEQLSTELKGARSRINELTDLLVSSEAVREDYKALLVQERLEHDNLTLRLHRLERNP